METVNQTPARIAKGTKRNEKAIIKDVTYNETTDSFVLHTTATKSNPKGIWQLKAKVFKNFANAAMKPVIMYAKEIIGATFNIESVMVHEGDAWLRGEGVYSKDHFTTVNQSIVRNALSLAEEKQAMYNAYYGAQFGAPSVATEKVVAKVPVDEGNADADEIQA